MQQSFVHQSLRVVSVVSATAGVHELEGLLSKQLASEINYQGIHAKEKSADEINHQGFWYTQIADDIIDHGAD